MGREIKFRIWDKKYESFYGNDSPDLFISTDGEVYEKDERNYAMQTYIEYNKSDFYEINQYTGLKDKNGKEIYEGDIYKRYDDIYVVFFDELGFKIKQIYDSWLDKNVYNRDKISLISKVDSNYSYEVIGNIYENPELLTA